MSLSLDLKKIKSSGIYRFVYDKSTITPSVAEQLSLVVGYSNKGPFNTPVYIDNVGDFEAMFGKASKKLEKKGIFFHRLAEEIIPKTPILALNLKPFDAGESVHYAHFDWNSITNPEEISAGKTWTVEQLYNTNRFWTLDPDLLPKKANLDKYFTLATTDTKDMSTSVFIRKALKEDVRPYDMTFREWFAEDDANCPEYITEYLLDENMTDYFAEVYVFKGKFTPELCGEGGVLSKYFNVDEDNNITLKPFYIDAFGDKKDTLHALAEDANSNYIDGYVGITLPAFKNMMGSYISIDIQINSNYSAHKLISKLDENIVYNFSGTTAELKEIIAPADGYVDDEYKYVVVNPDTLKKREKANAATSWLIDGEEQTALPEGTITVYGSDLEKYNELVKITVTTAATEATYNYYELTFQTEGEGTENQTTVYSYVSIDTSHSNDAVEVNAVPPEPNADSAQYIKVINVPGQESSSSDTYYRLEFQNEADTKLTPVYYEGYTYGTEINVESVMGVLTGDGSRGIRDGLTNHVDSEWRYLVDTFATNSTDPKDGFGPGYKKALVNLVKAKDNAFGILNFPSINVFMNDEGKRWYAQTGSLAGKFDISKVAELAGAFNLPSEADGASWVAFYTPYLSSDGAVKTYVPSAAAVLSRFLDKYTMRQPYYVVAGPTFGVLDAAGLTGPDFNYARTDLDVLEPMGVNCLVYQPRFGTYINSNQTAKQKPLSALSKVHVRELVIYLQDEIEDMMRGYQWELNTAALRNTIKAKADAICDRIMANGGIYDYLNTCDESNNDQEVIDNEMVILDTHIEPARAMGKMVQRLYIHKTGTISTFIA